MISFPKRERAQQAAAVVGVDAGKFSHTLVIRPRGQADSKPFSFPTTRQGFEAAVAFLRQQAPAAELCKMLVGIEFAGNYGFTFAHFLAELGIPIVSVLPAHTKRWKDVAHNQPLKTDAKDVGTITDLLGQGHFVTFPFLAPAYADLRYLVAARERLSLLRRAVMTQLRTLLQVVFPEFETIFPLLTSSASRWSPRSPPPSSSARSVIRGSTRVGPRFSGCPGCRWSSAPVAFSAAASGSRSAAGPSSARRPICLRSGASRRRGCSGPSTRGSASGMGTRR